MSSALVLQGSLDDVSVDEVLTTISLSRSCLRVEFDDEDAATIVVKAGNVLRAEGGSVPSGLSAFQALRRRHAGGFRVYRQPFDANNAQPIGTLAELLGASDAAAEHGYEPILAGVTGTDALSDVLDVMSLSRSLLELRLYRADGSVGVVSCKAGLVVAATVEPGGLEGRTALLAMMRVPPTRFELARASHRGRLPRPFGSLKELRRGADDTAGRRMAHRSVIRGDFEEHSFLDVLTIVTASRQVLEITLTRGGEWRGAVLVKAGKLLDARTEGGDVGVVALHALIADPGDAFDAVLSQRTRLPKQPLGDLRHLASTAPQDEQLREPSISPDDVTDDPSEDPPDEEITAIGPPPVLPVSPTAAELTHLARAVGRIEQLLSRQDSLLDGALRGRVARVETSPSRPLLLGILAAQLGVGVLLVVMIVVMLYV